MVSSLTVPTDLDLAVNQLNELQSLFHRRLRTAIWRLLWSSTAQTRLHHFRWIYRRHR